MALVVTQRPRFSDIDPAGTMGIRAMMTYFQDMTAAYMQDLDRGDDATLARYNTIWMFTRMKMVLARPAQTTSRITLSCWAAQTRTKHIVPMTFEAEDSEGPLAAGRLDACLFSLTSQKLATLDDIELDQSFEENRTPKIDLGRFRRVPRSLEGMESVLSHRVGYGDLDMAGHMNNVSYLRLVLNTRTAQEHATHPIHEMDLNFLAQCSEGEELEVYRQPEDEYVRYAVAPKGAETPAFVAALK